MANYDCKTSIHKTLTLNVVDVVTFTGSDPDDIEVVNRGTDSIYFTVNADNPTVAGNDTYVVTGGGALIVGGGNKVRLISASATAYSINRVAR